jgi:hypothetical protein
MNQKSTNPLVLAAVHQWYCLEHGFAANVGYSRSSSLLCNGPEGQLRQVAYSNGGKARVGEAAILPRLTPLCSKMYLLDPCLLNKSQQARVVGANLIGTMAVIRHDETSSHAQKRLFRVSVFGIVCS